MYFLTITIKDNLKIIIFVGYLLSLNLRGYFAEFLYNFQLFALVFSTYEPVSVQGTVVFLNIFFLILFLSLGLSILYSSVIAVAIILRGRIKSKWFNLSNLKPFRIRRIPLQEFFTLLMSAFSLQFPKNNETLFYYKLN